MFNISMFICPFPLPILFRPSSFLYCSQKLSFSGACAHGQSSRSEHWRADSCQWMTDALLPQRLGSRAAAPAKVRRAGASMTARASGHHWDSRANRAHAAEGEQLFLFGRCCSTSTVIIEADLGKFWLADNQTCGFICFTNKTWFT